jgi:hypothetical protein
MWLKKKDHEEKRDLYYLLPGMARGARTRYLRNLKISLLVGGIISIILGTLFYYASNKDRF